jgi:type IV pilus assembly protein PilN
VSINGYTQSQARVSTLMRNLESSPLFGNPALVEIRAVQVGGTRLNEFTLNVNIVRPAPGAKPAAGGAKK